MRIFWGRGGGVRGETSRETALTLGGDNAGYSSSFFCGFSFSTPLLCLRFFIPLQDGDDYHEFLFNQASDGVGIQKRWDSCTRRSNFPLSFIPGGARRSFVCLLFSGPFSTFGSSSFSCLYLPLLTSHYMHAPKFYHSSTAIFARMGDIRDRETGWLVLYRWRNRKARIPKEFLG